MVVDGLRGEIGIPLAKSSDQILVGLFPSFMLMWIEVEQAEPDAHISFPRSPERGEHSGIPTASRWLQQREVKLEMTAVNAVHAEAFIAKLNCLRFEAIELINRQQQAGPAGELGLENAAQSVDGVQIVKIEGSNERATSWSDDDKSFSLKTS